MNKTVKKLSTKNDTRSNLITIIEVMQRISIIQQEKTRKTQK